MYERAKSAIQICDVIPPLTVQAGINLNEPPKLSNQTLENVFKWLKR